MATASFFLNLLSFSLFYWDDLERRLPFFGRKWKGAETRTKWIHNSLMHITDSLYCEKGEKLIITSLCISLGSDSKALRRERAFHGQKGHLVNEPSPSFSPFSASDLRKKGKKCWPAFAIKNIWTSPIKKERKGLLSIGSHHWERRVGAFLDHPIPLSLLNRPKCPIIIKLYGIINCHSSE